MEDADAWSVTTHDWALEVDEAHLAHIRADAGRYGQGGVRHLILEVLAYAADEAATIGRVGTATITFGSDGAVSISDDGRGTDTRRAASGRPVRKPVMATRDVRFFDNADRPDLPDGLPRWGVSVVAALSTTLVHENRRGSSRWSQTYHYGAPATELLERPLHAAPGTTVTFTPDLTLCARRELQPSDCSAFESLRVVLGPT